jgi:hypothetical protein
MRKNAPANCRGSENVRVRIMSEIIEDVEFAHEHLSAVLDQAASYFRSSERLGVPTRCAGIDIAFNNITEQWELTIDGGA